MIPQQEEQREVVSRGVSESSAFRISERDASHIMQILRSTLYSDKVLAVLREYGSNAWDANRMAGRPDVPIEVHLPTLAEQVFRVRDHGPGLSPQDIREVFSQYGASTKRGDNVAVGMLGIGSKSGFAYGDSFNVTSWNGGMKRLYAAVLDETEAGRIDLMHEEPCDPAETGVEIEISVRVADIALFQDRAKIFTFFEPLPKINYDIKPVFPVGRDLPSGIGRIDEEKRGWGELGKWTAVMGCVPYPIKLEQLVGLSQHARNINGFIRFDVGDLKIAASRESLEYTDKTKENLTAMINLAIEEYAKVACEGIDKLPGWERRKRLYVISQRGIPIPPEYKGYEYGSVNLWNPHGKSGPGRNNSPLPEPTTFTLGSYSYDGRIRQDWYVSIDCQGVLIKDDKRSSAGFKDDARGWCIAIPKAGQTVDRKELLRYIADADLSGMPVELLSTRKWVQPPNKPVPKPRDNSRAAARIFTLDPNFVVDTKGRQSSAWIPAPTRSQQSTDIFVVLDSYEVKDMYDFYDRYKDDKRVLTSVGLQMPTIVGHKSTEKRPAKVGDFKGITYMTWRKTKMVELLQSVPEVEQALRAMSFRGSAWKPLPATEIVASLGKDHDVARFATEDVGGRMVLTKLKAEFQYAAKHVVSAALGYGSSDSGLPDSEGTVLKNRINQLYPLIRLSGGLDKLTDETTGVLQAWIDYIKAMDKVRQLAESEKQQTGEKAA